ncbi:MAG TPA: glycosyltransferase family 1 protein [Solirubrobacteraceae bacterium]
MTVVLVDGYALSDASRDRGIGTFLKRLLPGLSEAPGLSVRVLAEPGLSLPAGVARLPARRPFPARFRPAAHDLLLPRDLRRAEADVFHSPAQHPPRRSSLPWVQTLHDLTPLTWPHPLLERERRRWIKVGPRIRQAAAVATVSRFSADEAIRHLGLDPARLTVIPLGVDPAVFHPAASPRQEPPYLLHVAAWGPHKGFQEALAVIARLAELGLPHRLVLAGPQDAWMGAQVQAAVRASPRPDRVQVAGYVDDLPAVYRGAVALLMTSRCEGFGLPVLEAMACGTPVLAFANSAVAEVVGGAGVLVSDGDVDAMVQAVRRLVDSAAMRDELVQAGLVHSEHYRWADMATAYRQLFESVAR